MLKDDIFHCDKCGTQVYLAFGDTPPGWLHHPEMGDYCPPCKERVLA
jgi:hypothetical protein